MDILTATKKKSERVHKPRTLEAFLAWDQSSGKHKYEWVDNQLEKSDYMMKNTERGIVQKLQRAFTKTKAYQKQGELFAETPVLVTKERVRIPDLSFYSSEQIKASAQGEYPVPSWAIKIISLNETGFNIERKALEYMGLGVQVLWRVYPDLRMVHVRTSADKTQLYFNDDLCHAAPALPDLKIKVSELFS